MKNSFFDFREFAPITTVNVCAVLVLLAFLSSVFVGWGALNGFLFGIGFMAWFVASRAMARKFETV